VVASCGYWDNSIRCYGAEDGRLLQALRQHRDIVTCLALGSDGATLASGGAPCPFLIRLQRLSRLPRWHSSDFRWAAETTMYITRGGPRTSSPALCIYLSAKGRVCNLALSRLHGALMPAAAVLVKTRPFSWPGCAVVPTQAARAELLVPQAAMMLLPIVPV
jgi:hypothetical protein